MQFKEGADVYTHDGDKVGDVDRVVLDPGTDQVTHVVVRKGFLFPDDRVIPVDLLDQATKERVTLKKGIEDLDVLPQFEKAHYMRAEETEETAAYPEGYVRSYYWYPPTGYGWWGPAPYPLYPAPPYVWEIERNIPEGTVPLQEGARVISADGEQVGDVERVIADPKQERATHFVIAEGLLFPDKKLVPTPWIQSVSEGQIRLAINASLLENLPEYEG